MRVTMPSEKIGHPSKNTPATKGQFVAPAHVVEAEVTVNHVTVSPGNKWGGSIMPTTGYMDTFRDTAAVCLEWINSPWMAGRECEREKVLLCPLFLPPTSSWTHVHQLPQHLHLALMRVSLASTHKGMSDPSQRTSTPTSYDVWPLIHYSLILKTQESVWWKIILRTCIFSLPVRFRLRERNPGCFLHPSHGVCMWIAWGGSCGFEVACLSISFTHDVWTVMLSCGPGATREHNCCSVTTSTAASVFKIWRLLHLYVAPLFTECICPRRPSVYAQWDYSRSRHGVQGNVAFLLRDRLTATDEGRDLKVTVSLVTTCFFQSPISTI